MLRVLMQILSYASTQKKTKKKEEGFEISHFYGSFSSDMVVKGLTNLPPPPPHPMPAL